MAITWTKLWSGSDDGTTLRGIDIRNIQNDLALVLQTSDIGVTVQAFSDNTTTLEDTEVLNDGNIVRNGDFADFSAPPTPDQWVVEGGGVEAQDTTNVRVGANSYSITSDADGSASRQTIFATIDAITNSYWRDKTVTLTAQVYATDVTNARIQIDDGITTTESVYHTGTPGFEELSITKTISSVATKLDVVLLVDGNVLEAKFDAVRLNHGSLKWEFIKSIDDSQGAPAAPTVAATYIDYGTSGTTGTTKISSDMFVIYGVRSIGGATTATITGLPFTDATSYSVAGTFGTTVDAIEAIIITRDSGAQFTLRNTDNMAQTAHWIAVGT